MSEDPNQLCARWRQNPDDKALLEAAWVALRRAGRPIPARMLDARVQPPRTFDARTAMEITVLLPNGELERLPRTPSHNGLGIEIPSHQAWWVRPRRLRDVVSAVADIAELHGVGLSLEALRAQDPDLLHVASVPHLRWLSVARNTAITTTGLAHLAACTELLWLDIRRCKSVDSLAGLAQLPALASLTLETHVDDAMLASAGSLGRLSELRLSGARKVTGSTLGQLRGLTRLIVRSCRTLRADGLGSLRALDNLQELDLAHHQKLGNDAASLLADIPSLQDLNLRGWRKLTDEGLTAIAGLPNLTVLNVSRCPQLTGHGLEGCNSLVSLDMAETRVNDDTIRQVLRPRLRRLNLQMCPITTTSLDDIADLENLESLSLGRAGTPGGLSGDVCTDILADLPLRTLHLTGFNSLTRDGLTRLASLQTLNELVLDSSLHDVEGGLDRLATLDQLEVLSLAGATDIAASSGLEWIAGLQALHSLNLAAFGPGIDDVQMSAISKLGNLRSLDISGARLTRAGWNALRELNGLRHLRVRGMSLPAEALRCLPRQLQTLSVSQEDEVDKKRLRQLCPECEIVRS